MLGEYAMEVSRAVSDIGEMSEDDRRLLERLRASSPDERMEIMRNIEKPVHREVMATIRKGAREGVSEGERIAAIDVLVTMEDIQSVDLLFEIAEEASSLSERAEAVLAVKEIAKHGGLDVSNRLGELAGRSEMMQALVGGNA